MVQKTAYLHQEARHMLKQHADTKRTRGRGDMAPGHLATLNLLRKLEGELERVRLELATAWVGIDAARDFRKCSRHADAAQQRLHKTIRKLVGLKHAKAKPRRSRAVGLESAARAAKR